MPDRDGVGTGIWKIISVDQKPEGTPVKVGDSVYLKNLYSEGTYLDTCNTATCSNTTKYDVSTSTSQTRDGSGTGTWKIISFFQKPDGTLVKVGDLVHLKNKYGEGTYLDTCGTATCSNTTRYDVSTSTSATRDGSGTGTWTFIPALLK